MTAPGGTAEALPQLGSPAPHVRRRSSGGSAVMRRVSSLGSYKGSPVKISRFYGGAVHRLSDNTLLGSSVSQTAPLWKEAFKKAAKDVTDGCRVRSPLDANWLVDATISDVANFHFSWSIGDDLVFIVGVDKTYPDTVGQQALQEFKRQFAEAASKGRKADIKKLVKTIVVALSDIYDNPDAVDAGDVGFKQLDLATPTSAMTVADVELMTPVSLDAATPKILAHLQPQARPSPPPDTAQPRKQQYQQEPLKGRISIHQQQQQPPRRDVTTILPPPPPQQQQQQQQRKGVSSHDRQHARPPLPPTPPPPPPPPPQQLEDMMRTVQLAPPDSKLPAEATTQQAAQEFRVNVNDVQRRAASQRYKYATILLSGIGTFILGLSLPVIVYYVKGDLQLPVQA